MLGKRLIGSAPYALPGLAVMLLAWTYFAGVKYWPQRTGDESSLLDIPYRFCQFHDFRYPATWSQSFGSDQVRKYPPISAFLLRDIYHGVVGFSALSSRIFSGLLILSVLLSTFLLFQRFVCRPGGSWVFLFLCQLGLTPVLIYNARTTRFEQEVFFLGAWGCIGLPCLMSSISSRVGQGVCWVLVGISLALAATSHPFGVVFLLVGVCWYFWCMRREGGLDHLTGWRRLGFLGTGLVLGLLPTALWLGSDLVNTVRFTRALSAIYAAREPDMVAYLAALPPWHWLTRFAPLHWAARLNALDTAAYLENSGYPVANYRFKVLVHGWFYVQLVVVMGYFFYSLSRRFRNGTAWTHLPVWLAVGFVGCMVLYTPPNTTYNLYPAFFVSLAFVVIVWSLWCERWRLSAAGRATAVTALGCLIGSTLLLAHYAAVHAVQLAHRLKPDGEPAICLDQEFRALRSMASRLALDRPGATVYTSTESWIAAGRDNRALLESAVLGQDADWSKVDGV
ncbi:MAG TPA: hypothetical protein VFA18_05110, partial [Gemmataceae bacterium]|nr:hypothetical protein [Gemmataceae bacterium]